MSLICPASSKVATMDTRFLKLCCSDIAHGRCDEIHEVFLKLRYVKFTPALSKDHCDQLYICQRGRSGFGDGIRELELELPQHLDTNIFPFQNKNNIHLSNKYNCQKLRILNHSVHFLSMTVFEYFSYFQQNSSQVMVITRVMTHLVANLMLLTVRRCGRLRELKLCQVVFGGYLREYKLIKTIVVFCSNFSTTTPGRCAAITVHAYNGHPEILALGNPTTQMTSTPTLQLMNTGGLQDVISHNSLDSFPTFEKCMENTMSHLMYSWTLHGE